MPLVKSRRPDPTVVPANAGTQRLNAADEVARFPPSQK